MLRSRFRIIVLLIVFLGLGYELWPMLPFADGHARNGALDGYTAEPAQSATRELEVKQNASEKLERDGDGNDEPIRGIFISGWVAGERLDETLQYMKEHDLNTVVIDIKDNDGLLSFAMPGTVAQSLGANGGKMGSQERARRLIRTLQEEGVYVIGRLVLFQDNFLPLQRPHWALRTETGALWRDNNGGYWLDPSHRGVLEYHAEIAIEAARLGFDEIQFDYLRYPSQPVPGYNTNGRQARTETITRFARLIKQRIQQSIDVPVSGAVYGIIAVSENDYYVGQDYIALSRVLDSISPMFYPSHYAPGDFGLADPNLHPYTTLFASTAAALSRTSQHMWGKLRPWIQSFFGYEAEDIEEQIQALHDLGIDSFLVWNPQGRYVSGVNYQGHQGEHSLANSPFRAVLYPLMSPAAGLFVVDPYLKLPTHLGNTSTTSGVEVLAESSRNSLVIEVRHRSDTVSRMKNEEAGDTFIVMRRTLSEEERIVPKEERESLALRVTNIVNDDDGVELTWREGKYVWSLWAPTLSDAFRVKRSLASVPTPLLKRCNCVDMSES